jgi:hypothetical protein
LLEAEVLPKDLLHVALHNQGLENVPANFLSLASLRKMRLLYVNSAWKRWPSTREKVIKDIRKREERK